ncbi:hypothetical protein YTPLAS73_12110 [Nitrosarchaeum sp.]|nr:hypothetical protein YTPLAS73_12110 [Nitrosarchaeum sp.]
MTFDFPISDADRKKLNKIIQKLLEQLEKETNTKKSNHDYQID